MNTFEAYILYVGISIILGLSGYLLYSFQPHDSIKDIPAVPIHRTIIGMLKRLPFDDMLIYSTQQTLLHKYKLIRAYFQGHWTLMVGCPDMAAKMYSDVELFPKLVPDVDQPNSVFAKLTGHSAFFANGATWRHHRKEVIGSHAFSQPSESSPLSPDHLNMLMNKIDSKIAESGGDKIDTLDLMQRATFDCLSKQFLNQDFKLLDGTSNDAMLHLFDNAFAYGFTLLTTLFPSLQSSKNPLYSKIYHDINRWEDCLMQVIKATRKRIAIEGVGSSPDLVTKMIASTNFSNGATDIEVLNNLKMLFLPSQSLPPALCAALHYLAQNPVVQNHAYTEILSVMGISQDVLTEKNIASMPYMSAIIKETLRLYPTLCPPPKRMASRDTTLGGIFIPKGTHLMIDMFAIQRDPNLWTNPDQFDPTRFLNNKSLSTPNMALRSGYMPFGAGARRCPGSALSNSLMMNILAKIIRNNHIRYPAPSTASSTKPSLTINFKLKLKAQVVLIPDNLELEYVPRV